MPDAIAKARAAGIRVIMITGDHPHTALAIAREIGLVQGPEPEVVTGDRLRVMSEAHLTLALDAEEILFARIGADQKLRVVQALQRRGEIVAVTGDGVNDAPALKQGDIGIAMGRGGTDVAREAADMVLLDDNFASIVNAVEEGRAVFANIRKFMTYILASNVPELVPYLAFGLLGVPLPLTVIQILAVDLGTDMLPALALGVEPPHRTAMIQPPRSRRQPLLTAGLILRAYLLLGLFEAVAALSAYFAVLYDGGWQWGQGLASGDLLYRQATTACLVAIVLGQVANVFLCRGERDSILDRRRAAQPVPVVGRRRGDRPDPADRLYRPRQQPVRHGAAASLGLGGGPPGHRRHGRGRRASQMGPALQRQMKLRDGERRSSRPAEGSVRHQHWNIHVVEHGARGPAENPFPQTGAAERPHQDEVGFDVPRRFEDGRPGVGAGGIGCPYLRFDAMTFQIGDNVEQRPELGAWKLLTLLAAHEHHDAIRLLKERHSANHGVRRLGAAVPGDEDAFAGVEERPGGGNDQDRAARRHGHHPLDHAPAFVGFGLADDDKVLQSASDGDQVSRFALASLPVEIDALTLRQRADTLFRLGGRRVVPLDQPLQGSGFLRQYLPEARDILQRVKAGNTRVEPPAEPQGDLDRFDRTIGPDMHKNVLIGHRRHPPANR